VIVCTGEKNNFTVSTPGLVSLPKLSGGFSMKWSALADTRTNAKFELPY